MIWAIVCCSRRMFPELWNLQHYCNASLWFDTVTGAQTFDEVSVDALVTGAFMML